MTQFSNPPQFLELMSFFGPKIVFAFVCGGIIGLERELKHKAAGIKTNMLICVGAALYSSVSVLIASLFSGESYFGDPGRISAQIVSGIGFLGGGAIIQARGTIVGLTTAASIWVVAAIGICVGLGYYSLGLASSVMVVGALVGVTAVERKFIGQYKIYSFDILADEPDSDVKESISNAIEENDLSLMNIEVTNQNDVCHLRLTYQGHDRSHKLFLLHLWSLKGIKEIKEVLR